MSEDGPDEELGEASEKMGGIAGRFDETSEMSETSEMDSMRETSETTETSELPSPGDPEFDLRDHWNGRTIYLPDELVEEIDLRYQELSLEWQREYGEHLPKNEQYYPAVIRAALQETSIEEELDLNES